MSDDEVQYEQQSVKVVRGREANKVAEMQKLRWELVSQTQGTLRTEMTFRRVRRKFFYAPWMGGVALAVFIVVFFAFNSLGSDGDSEPSDAPTAAETTPREETPPSNTDELSEEPTEATDEPTEEPEPDADEVLTAANNEDLKRLLTSSEDAGLSKAFVKKYRGRKIEFDGNVANAASHNGASTRFDFLIYTGDYTTTSVTPGPQFQFRDVNFYDLNVKGGSRVGLGTNLHIVATVEQFEQRSGLFVLDPVATRIRR